jgi:hypothetical protein
VAEMSSAVFQVGHRQRNVVDSGRDQRVLHLMMWRRVGTPR